VVVVLLNGFQLLHLRFKGVWYEVTVGLGKFCLFFLFWCLPIELLISLGRLLIGIIDMKFRKGALFLGVEFDLDIVNPLVEEVDVPEGFKVNDYFYECA
jgi:hypothetical protein